ncbi:unnamed protein product, partial [Mesorhabditis belari]|uniref:Putative alpha-L-fucosidase n=1 Tax=Mesorhabditis belari TaxID=2138241 RepID=A0AAF3FBK3_9BILA
MFSAFLSFILFSFAKAQNYQPTWDSLDSRPLPDWYDEGKFGIFMHWGAYSSPAFRSEWLWYYWKGKNEPDVLEYIRSNYPPRTTYADFVKMFKGEFFDADMFREIVEASGAKYFVFTTKHHEGFTMWPSSVSWNWNSMNIGPKRDIVGELQKAFSKSDVHFGLYYSLFEWYHPLFDQDLAKNTTEYRDKISFPQLLDIVNKYQPDILWGDGDWGLDENYWKTKEFITWLYNESPVKDRVVINDRWGDGTIGKHGGYMTYADNYQAGELLERKWENCDSVDQWSWGYRRTMNVSELLTAHDVIAELARTISCNGNFLLNVGPDSSGMIPTIFEARLRETGDFIKANAEAVYGTKAWVHQNDTNNIWYTSRLRDDKNLRKNRSSNPQDEENTIIYVWILDLNQTVYTLEKVSIGERTKVSILSTETPLDISIGETGQLVVSMSKIPWQSLVRTDCLVLKIEYAKGETPQTPETPKKSAILEKYNLFSLLLLISLSKCF